MVMENIFTHMYTFTSNKFVMFLNFSGNYHNQNYESGLGSM